MEGRKTSYARAVKRTIKRAEKRRRDAALLAPIRCRSLTQAIDLVRECKTVRPDLRGFISEPYTTFDPWRHLDPDALPWRAVGDGRRRLIADVAPV